ncbi:MAG: hypothetical protein AAFZ15_22585 [Bacteroidota bacterium]
MDFSNYYQKFWPAAFLLAIMTCALACSKDDAKPFPPLSQVSGDCPINMSYEVTTAAFTQAADQDEQTELTPAEQVLAYPTFTRCSVDVCIEVNGTMSASVQMLALENEPNYPKGTIGLPVIPDKYMVDRVEINGGTATHYNSQGEVIETQILGDASSIDFYSKIIEDMVDFVPLNAEQMSWVIEGFKEAGFDMTPINDDLEMLTQPFADGSYSKVVLDKKLRVIRGQADYDPSGKLLTKSSMTFTGEAENPIVTGHKFVAYLTSPYSQKRMAMTRRSRIENFSLTKNQ